jgi:fimbrial chaperone protein
MKYILLCGLFLLASAARANLLISPTSVFITDRERVEEVILVNTGNKTNTYRLSFKDMLQNEYGAYQNVAEEDFEYSASKFIRFSPRQVSLKPGERQTVKLVVRRNNSLEVGDYRSHLSFSILPTQITDNDIEDPQSSEGFGIKLTPMVSYSIPVVLEVGDPEVEIVITKVSLQNNPEGNRQTVSVNLSREGKKGVFGKLELFATDQQGKSQLIGELNNANIFRESYSRNFSVNLHKKIKVNNDDQVLVKYTDTAKRKELLAQNIRIESE